MTQQKPSAGSPCSKIVSPRAYVLGERSPIMVREIVGPIALNSGARMTISHSSVERAMSIPPTADIAAVPGSSCIRADGWSRSAGAPGARPPHAGDFTGLTRVAVRKQLEQPISLGAERLREMPHDEARIGANLMLVVVGAHETDHRPTVRSEFDGHRLCGLAGPVFRPRARIHKIAVAVHCRRSHSALVNNLRSGGSGGAP